MGYGAIGRRLAGFIADGAVGRGEVVATLVRDPDRHAAAERGAWSFVRAGEDLLAARPDVIVEAAGHDAVRSHVAGFLTAGVDTLIVSIGAMADDELYKELRGAAGAGRSRLLLATGAVGSLDALSAARHIGLTEVRHTIRKPRSALGRIPDPAASTPGGDLIAFAGSAREAALAFPANANVVAAVAFAGIGLDQTEVRIMSSPISDRNIHEIHAAGAFGELDFRIANRSAPDNPRSSLLAAGSLAAALARRTAAVVLA